MLFTYGELFRSEGPMEIACLTLYAHWAAAVFQLGKDVENRTWSTKYRGPLAIHAGRKIDRLICAQLHLDPRKVKTGVILGVVDLVDVIRDSCSKWASPKHYHWIIENPRLLDRPVPHVGRQTLYRVTLDSRLFEHAPAVR